MSDLYKEEYQTLRKEVETSMAELNTLESSVLFAVAAIFAWLVTHKSEGAIHLGWFIPSVLVFFCMLRAWSINRHLGWLGEYLKRYEEAHIQPQLRGWEHFIGDPEEGGSRPRRAFRGKVTFFFWAVLFTATTGGGYLGYIEKPVASEVAKSDENC